MEIETKYDFGDRPYKINTEPKKSWKICPFCNGKGDTIGQDESSQTCPKCYGHKGKWIFGNNCMRVMGQLTIGEIKVQIRGEDPVGTPGHGGAGNYGPQKAKYEETYMCKETGIGSGSLHNVSSLWPTEKEAQAECKRRNEEDAP